MPNKPKHSHSDRDEIYTPENIVQHVLSKIPFEVGDSACDPCYGDGVFYDNFLSYIDESLRAWYEIKQGKDFLSCTNRYDWCITNIPFSKPKEFIFKMAECSKKGFGILCLANSMTATRLQKLEKMGFFLYYQCVIYVKEWGFGYRTDFYVFTRNKTNNLEVLIQ